MLCEGARLAAANIYTTSKSYNRDEIHTEKDELERARAEVAGLCVPASVAAAENNTLKMNIRRARKCCAGQDGK